MWKIDSKYLQGDEKIEYTDRPSMLSCILAYIWVGFMALGMVSVLYGSTLENENIESFRSFGFVYLILALPGIYIILRRLSTRFAISNRGLIKRVGIITTSIKTVPFKHITSVEVKEPITGKIFKYAHLLIDTSGSGGGVEFKWDYVTAAHKVKKLIDKHIVD